MRYSILILLVLGAVGNSHALTFVNYSWEDDGTVLGVRAEGTDPDLPRICVTNVAREDGHPVHQSEPIYFGERGLGQWPFWPQGEPPPWPPSNHSLRIEQIEPCEAIIVYLAYEGEWDWGAGSEGTGFSVWCYVESLSESMSLRLGGHWCDGQNEQIDVQHNDGDAGGVVSGPVPGRWINLRKWWSNYEMSPHDGLVVEFWIHGNRGDVVYLDELQVAIDTGDCLGCWTLLLPGNDTNSGLKILNTPQQPNITLSAYPNPFNPQTTIGFTLEQRQHARIAVFDLTGMLLGVLANNSFDTGNHSVVWNGRDSQGHAMPSGTYVVRLETSSSVEARKVMLLR